MAKDKKQQPLKQPEDQTPIVRRKLSLFTQLCILLSVVCCLLYANTLFNNYAFDDPVVIEKNKFVTEGISAIPKLLATPHLRGFYVIPNDLYRPLSLVMFAIEYQFFGLNPMTGHLFNILTLLLSGQLLVWFGGGLQALVWFGGGWHALVWFGNKESLFLRAAQVTTVGLRPEKSENAWLKMIFQAKVYTENKFAVHLRVL